MISSERLVRYCWVTNLIACDRQLYVNMLRRIHQHQVKDPSILATTAELPLQRALGSRSVMAKLATPESVHKSATVLPKGTDT